MITSDDMAKSLGFYIHLKKKQGADKTACLAVDDYHDAFADVEDEVRKAANIVFSPEHPFIPLSDITLTQFQHSDIVDQIYDGVSFMSVSLVVPPPSPPPAVATHYFENYVVALGHDANTDSDVCAIMGRIKQQLGDRAADRQRVNGLVVGRVQSGKTRNYVGLMLKALDEGWNVVLVLTSANTALADQTQSRIKNDLDSASVYDGTVLDIRSGAALDKPASLKDPSCKKFYWGVAMKQKDNLERVLQWFADSPELTPKMRVLVIDDEADNATPDSNAGAKANMTDDDIINLAADIRDEDGDADVSDFSDLADWVLNLPDLVEERFKEAARDPGCRTDEQIQAIRALLDSGNSKAEIRNKIITEQPFVRLLELRAYASEEDGHTVDVAFQISKYFNKAKGAGPRTAKKFVDLLRAVFDVVEERSMISALVCKLVDCPPQSETYTFTFATCAYVAYTATPYACILNERPDETPLYADFIYSLQVSPKYFGLDKIFGQTLGDAKPHMNIVDPIPDEDVRFVLRPMQGIKDAQLSPKTILAVSSLDENLCYTCENPAYSGSWDSMCRALAWAFCTAGARAYARATLALKKDDLGHRWTTMLVNISQKQGVHRDQKDVIFAYLKARCATPESRADFLALCRRTWNDLTAAFTKADFDQLFNADAEPMGDYGAIADYPAWSDIEADIRLFVDNFLTRVHVIVINSANAKNIDQQNEYNQVGNHKGDHPGDHLWIICGGNTISRGLTLHGLTTSYFDRVRKSVAVDTMTQMGRWFGYRAGYELFPRIWMTSATAVEMKKAAIIESRMHESIRENFDAGFSPSDPAHYQQIYCWGRRLSGRDHAQQLIARSVGTMATTDDLWIDAPHVSASAGRMRTFLSGLGPAFAYDLSVYRVYNTFPLWRNVSKEKIRDYLNAQAADAPVRTRAVFKAMVNEIDRATSSSGEPLLWDVVVGEPDHHEKNKKFDIGVGHDVKSFSPTASAIENGDGGCRAHYKTVRSDMAFYAMIPTNVILEYESSYLLEHLDAIAEKIEAKAKNGILPPMLEKALERWLPGEPVKARLKVFLRDVYANAKSGSCKYTEIPACIRECVSLGFRNRSASEYRESVYDEAKNVNPVLQIDLIAPSADAGSSADPIVTHAFYWPNHVPDEFHCVAAGLPPKHATRPDARAFGAAVVKVLADADFPLTPGGGLRDGVMAILPNCDENFFNLNIAKNPAHAPYDKMPESDAYFARSWASSPAEALAKVREFVVERACAILADHAPHAANALAMQITAECTRLEKVYPLIYTANGCAARVNAKWKTAMNDVALAARGIEIVSRHPLAYRLP